MNMLMTENSFIIVSTLKGFGLKCIFDPFMVERYIQDVVRQNSPPKIYIFQIYHYFTIRNFTYKISEGVHRLFCVVSMKITVKKIENRVKYAKKNSKIYQ